MKIFWNWFCQKIADRHFYKWIRTKKYRELDLYMAWTERKLNRRAR